MPELPEVETVVRDLAAAVTGRTVIAVEGGHPKIVRHPDPVNFRLRMRGRRIVSVTRRGKFIIFELDGGEVIAAHLGMTGHFTVVQPSAPLPAHTHARLMLDDGRELRFDDARRFGRIVLGDSLAQLQQLGAVPALGVEPLSEDFTQAHVDGWLRHSHRQLKAALLDQRHVAGLGNIYADEACFRAAVRPTRRCDRLRTAERRALRDAIAEVLSTAIANRGSSVDNYRDVWNAKGSNQERLMVYGRGGQPCLVCATPLKKLVIAQRTTVYCPTCQR
jgi:formamidopyrimidine-DNA glycosylase